MMLLLLPQIGISVDSIMSGSMEPVLRTGGIVFTDTKERRPEIGDIVTYQVGETRVTTQSDPKRTQRICNKR
ncbi:MAG: S24/S26 family peptidase [Lachnospiraceae bacterium]